MTVLEASYTYGVKIYNTSVGDDIHSIVDRIYKSREDVYYLVIQTLNHIFDWDNITPGEPIKYLPKYLCSEIDEVNS